MASDGAAVPDPHVIVLFGALGDLSRRKLLPGLFHLERAGLMPQDYRILGTSRRGGTDDEALGGDSHRLHYLSIPPGAFGDTVQALGDSGLAERARVVLEKPFGMDLE